MGKYQLDYKGQKQVERFHEKNSRVKGDQKARVKALKERFIEKKTNKD
ncbi:hypothetical protein [Streptococcus pacificus]|uniref:30S ribosomal protein S10 n=1 Tax=Streptococcus pacificus TaxID=2740577 RepID=A0ABS0ZJZ5_9STRE|nr:hypothetical protein [Streptococcus pacificus]MBJ8326282.1 hypothetical protein [Streptococcus pacificus]